jgi:hypothetical protein
LPEEQKGFTQRRKGAQGAKIRKEELACFLCGLGCFAPLRTMLLFFQELFRSFCGITGQMLLSGCWERLPDVILKVAHRVMD